VSVNEKEFAAERGMLIFTAQSKMKTVTKNAARINDKSLRWIFYSSWLVINILQALFTNLLYDEAYYWVCSGELAWGHFYYPPLIDPLIRAGYSLFHNELGVRFAFILLSTGGIYLLEKLLLRDDLKLYYTLLLSIVFFQVTSIIAAPDIPLFFLSVTFYLFWRRFLEKDSLLLTLALALNTALLLFTKYHGILLIGFTFIGNLAFLLKKKKSYIWIISSVLLFLPHLIWQYKNGFPTVMFHLFERPGGGLFEWKNVLDYIPGQFLFAGPLISILLFIALLKSKREDRYQKTLFFNLTGMYVFFLLVSVYHHVEINWTVIGIAPLILLAHKSISENEKLRKWVFRLLPYSLAIALIFRVLLLFPSWFENSRLSQELYGYKEWSMELKEAASGRPLVFSERYQRVAAYAFYSGDPLYFTLNPTQKSDFDYMDLEEQIQGRDVLFASRYHNTLGMDSLVTVKGTWYLKAISNFRSYKKFRFVLSRETSQNPDTLCLNLQPENPYPWEVSFNENPELPARLGYQLYLDGRLIRNEPACWDAPPYANGGTLCLPIRDLEPGEYKIMITLKTGWLPEYQVSRLFEFFR